jgi:hypothetical protein
MMDPLDTMFFLGPNHTCDLCGIRERESELQFGERVMTMRTMGLCCECFIIVCGQCAGPGSRCPKCGSWLLNPDYPPNKPSWLHPIKRIKYMRLFGI